MNSTGRLFCMVGGLLVLSGCTNKPVPQNPIPRTPAEKELCMLDAQQQVLGRNAKTKIIDAQDGLKFIITSIAKDTEVLSAKMEDGKLDVVTAIVKQGQRRKTPYAQAQNSQKRPESVMIYTRGSVSPELGERAFEIYESLVSLLIKNCHIGTLPGAESALMEQNL